jgi:hypothetical protein
MKPKTHKTKRAAAVACTDWLGPVNVADMLLLDRGAALCGNFGDLPGVEYVMHIRSGTESAARLRAQWEAYTADSSPSSEKT